MHTTMVPEHVKTMKIQAGVQVFPRPEKLKRTTSALKRLEDFYSIVYSAIVAEGARHVNVGNDARGSGPTRGQDAEPAARECTFARFMKCNPTAFRSTEGAVELLRWFEKTESIFRISDCVEGKKVMFVTATLQGPALTWWNSKIATMGLETGLTDNIKGEVTSSKLANLNEAMRIAYKLMDQKLQARDERNLEGKKQKWKSFQSGNSSGYAIFDNKSIERDRLIGNGFVLDFVEFISFTFGDKEMISVIEAVSCKLCELNDAKIERSG
ncbi:hypothetical protein Tco_0173087 [Tanacetum coccineum]